jgi:hypothetical protein
MERLRVGRILLKRTRGGLKNKEVPAAREFFLARRLDGTAARFLELRGQRREGG